MKILHITDSHGTVKSPEGRTDIYYLSFLKKFYELKYVIKNFDIKLIIHTGDLFHSARVSDKFTGQVAEIIKSYGIPMYVVPGNHDIDGYSINTLDQTKLGLLYKTGVVKELDRRSLPIQLKSSKENLTVTITGQEYYKDIDTGSMSDFEMGSTNQSDFNILAIHGYLCDKPQHPSINFTLCDNIVTDADVILSGHFHESFEYHGADFSIYNPGSLMRVEQTTYNKHHMPQYGILDITNNNGVISHSYTMYPFRVAEPSESVFDYTLKNEKKRSLITLENFKNSIANTNLNNNLSVSIENIIADTAQNLSVTEEIKNKTIDIYCDALNSSPDKLEVQQGFVCDPQRKIITSVDIHNFQSHEHTVVNFKDGLNVIIGESNSGKTSILRAIRWCLDNDPHGSDFITTGQDECEVSITFDDGTQIVRKRTRDESGTYNVIGKTIQPDGSITHWTDTYKGFANSLPVEIVNIHQMPKINLTKDICTHLNMMSQLDGPFLITDSPQVKAAVIGRLTGTQIIDLAVKETNKTVLANSKTIKVYNQEKQQKETELQRFEDLEIYRKYVDIGKHILQFYKDEYTKLKGVAELDDELCNRSEVMKNLKEVFLYHENQVVSITSLLNIERYVIKQKEILNLCKEVRDAVNRIAALKKKVIWLTILTSLIPFVREYKLKIEKFIYLKNTLTRFTEVRNQISQHTEVLKNGETKINCLAEFKTCLKDINIYINVLSKDISSSRPLYDKLNLRNGNREKEKNNYKMYDKTVQELEGQVNELVKQQEQLIKESNICPCCGQKLTTQKQVKNINAFMKGKSHG